MLLSSLVGGLIQKLCDVPTLGAYPVTVTLFLALGISVLTQSIYNVFFHPLNSYPGPLLWRAARLPYVVRALQGRLVYDMLKLHKRYGPIVRVAPNELSVQYEDAWEEVHGGTYDNEMQKWKPYYRVQPEQTGFIMTAPPEDHSKMRRALSYGFSDRGIHELESHMITTLDIMLDRLIGICGGQDHKSPHKPVKGDVCLGEATIDVTKWCNFITFDMIGMLTFGESFNCLKTGTYHPWVEPIVKLTRYSGILANLGFYPKFQELLLRLFGGVICRRMNFHQNHSRAALERRAEKEERSDLLSESLKQAQVSEHHPLSWDKLVMNASTLVVAGSETSATTLTAALYLILSNPDSYHRLQNEVRSAFRSKSDINIFAVNKLVYMLACLNETMRMLPAVPGGLPRVVSSGGRVLNGKFVPEDTIVAIWHWALYHNDNFFQHPFEFHPERFLGVPDFMSDARHMFQPFHVGRRACIGRSLAYAEMKLILARLIFEFDMEIVDKDCNWLRQLRPFNFWYKTPLYVRIKARECLG
ncbi:cytochrome P450 monooxygenase [Phaeosphaeria sp. MPI-PUGE-AT-0046c]|nr:cytochrome P450 monooxygenase [Phaeosphaeria sp. MPI-PUGE-AT-0046c]